MLLIDDRDEEVAQKVDAPVVVVVVVVDLCEIRLRTIKNQQQYHVRYVHMYTEESKVT